MPNLTRFKKNFSNKREGLVVSVKPQYRSEGDKARDNRDWQSAVENYRKYLELRPDDVAIWVQLGHALKETRAVQEAESAYTQAVLLSPDDADAQLQLGHVLKQLDRPKRAAAAFREVMKLAPSEAIYNELRSLGFEADAALLLENAPAREHEHGRYFELRDLFEYLFQHVTVTGISRVVIGLVRYVIEEMPDDNAAQYHFVHQFGAGDALWLISKTKLRRLINAAMAETVDHEMVVSIIHEIRGESPFVKLHKGDLYFIPGAFWDAASSPTFLPSLKSQGVMVGAYIYDLIPITHPHYCMSGLTQGFNIAFAESATCFDFTLTISGFVADQVNKFLASRNLRRFPTIPVPLAHELEFRKRRTASTRQVNPAVSDLLEKDFVLCVCTIEARKNHIYLFYIWQEMINDGLDVPDLVFVGRYGWRIGDLIGQIDASHHLDGRLHILHGLSDADLSALYDSCSFTVFPSFVEGWGLPVGESLAHGKVCVASSASSIPEVGGSLATYIDPFNLHSGTEVIRRLIADPGYRKGLETRIRKEFVPRTWTNVGSDFFSRLDATVNGLAEAKDHPSRTWPSLASGDWLDVFSLQTDLIRKPDYVKNPLRLVFSEGWRNMEETGTWMRGQTAALRFATGEPEGTEVFVLLNVSTSEWAASHNAFQIWIGEASQKLISKNSYMSNPMPKDRRYWVRLRGATGPEGLLTIRFKTSGEVNVVEPHIPVLARVHGFGFALNTDYAARLDLLEQAVLPT